MTDPRITEALIQAMRLARGGLDAECNGLEILLETIGTDEQVASETETLRGLVEALLVNRYGGWR